MEEPVIFKKIFPAYLKNNLIDLTPVQLIGIGHLLFKLNKYSDLYMLQAEAYVHDLSQYMNFEEINEIWRFF